MKKFIKFLKGLSVILTFLSLASFWFCMGLALYVSCNTTGWTAFGWIIVAIIFCACSYFFTTDFASEFFERIFINKPKHSKEMRKK